MEQIRIRKATERDIDSLVTMRFALQKHLEESDPSVWKFSADALVSLRKELRSRFANETSFVAIAETDESHIPVGMLQADIIRNTGYDPPAYGHIHIVYVAKPARGNGIGKRLVKLAADFFAIWRIEHINVGYVLKNKEAVAFWTALGFNPRILHATITKSQLDEI